MPSDFLLNCVISDRFADRQDGIQNRDQTCYIRNQFLRQVQKFSHAHWQLSQSISGQRHDLTIYAMCQRARADNLTT